MMIKKFVKAVKDSQYEIKDGTLFCDNIEIDLDLKDYLENNRVFENTVSNDINSRVKLEMSLAYLVSIGFYDTCERYINKHRYSEPSNESYILEIDSFITDETTFREKYLCIIGLIKSIQFQAKHSYSTANIEYSIIVKEDKSLFLSFNYCAKDLIEIDKERILKIKEITEIFSKSNSEVKILYLNELIAHLSIVEESKRFKYLLESTCDYWEKCQNAHQFYLSNYSYNKLKIEIDTKALDFTQKIQSVINDSQTKLIAIPTAFVLEVSVLDYNSPISIKNAIAIISSIIFSFLVQLFLNNQTSALSFIESSITSYKELLVKENTSIISSKFKIVEDELTKQKRRLLYIQILLWIIPIILLLSLFVLNCIKTASILGSFLY